MSFKNWKINLLNYAWIEQQSGSACYCLSAQTAQMLLTVSQSLAWSTRWEGNELFTPEQKENIFKWANNAEAELMNSCCGDNTDGPIPLRITANGTVQAFINGEWVDSPQYDPRQVGQEFQPLPYEGDTGRCAGADNVVANVQDAIEQIVEQLETEAAFGTILAVLLGLLAIFITVASAGTAIAASGLLVSLVTAAMTIGAASINASFDLETWNTFKCLVYCVIEEDQTITSAGIAQLKTAIAEEYADSVVINMLNKVIDAMGPIGLTNMARTGTATGTDCEACECANEPHCRVWNFEESEGDWVIIPSLGRGQYVEGIGFVGTAASEDRERIIIELAFSESIEVTALAVNMTNNAPTANHTEFYIGEELVFATSGTVAGVVTWTGSQVGGTARIDLEGQAGSTLVIENVQINYNGNQVFGSDNCEE